MRTYNVNNTGLSAPLFDVLKNKANDLVKGINAPEVKTSVKVENTTLDAVKVVSVILGASAILTALIISNKSK